MTTTPHGLARRSVGAGALWVLGVSASAPLTVLAGGVTAAYAASGVIAVPAAFLVLMVALLLFAVGFSAMSRDVPHAATFAAFLSLGLGRVAGVAGASVALLAYNAIQICLYGLIGATTSSLLGGQWWIWALVAWAVVAALGVGHVALNVGVIAALLIAELVVIFAFDFAGFTNPAPASDASIYAPLSLGELFVDGAGGVLALTVASFIGVESVTAFSEEARHPGSVARALLAALGFLGVFYAASSWAMAVAVGSDNVVDAARTAGSDIPFAVLEANLGSAVAGFGLALLALSIIGAMISFHNVVARYLFALGREGVVPSGLGTTLSGRSGTPIGGSILQSGLALVSVGVFAVLGADPLVMFTLLATLAAIGVMALMVAACVAVISWYLPPDKPDRPNLWTRMIAPAGGAIALLGLLTITLASLGSTTGDATLTWLLPAIMVAVATAGAGWATWLRHNRPGVWDAIGRGQPKPLAVLDRALHSYEL